MEQNIDKGALRGLLELWAKAEPEYCIIEEAFSDIGANVHIGDHENRGWHFIYFCSNRDTLPKDMAAFTASVVQAVEARGCAWKMSALRAYPGFSYSAEILDTEIVGVSVHPAIALLKAHLEALGVLRPDDEVYEETDKDPVGYAINLLSKDLKENFKGLTLYATYSQADFIEQLGRKLKHLYKENERLVSAIADWCDSKDTLEHDESVALLYEGTSPHYVQEDKRRLKEAEERLKALNEEYL